MSRYNNKENKAARILGVGFSVITLLFGGVQYVRIGNWMAPSVVQEQAGETEDLDQLNREQTAVEASKDKEITPTDIEAVKNSTAKYRDGYPNDLYIRPLVCEAVIPGNADVYGDPELTDVIDSVIADDLVMTVTDTSEQGFYGTYTDGINEGEGWIDQEVFVVEPSFEKIYRTVREEMPVNSLRTWRGRETMIEKYSGIILLSKDGNKKQILYETADGYGIGWIKSEYYQNSLKYDGREKQILANGEYSFINVDTSRKMRVELVYITDNQYYIFRKDTEHLTVFQKEGDPHDRARFEDTTPDTEASIFTIAHEGDNYVIRSVENEKYLRIDETGHFRLTEDITEVNTTWRIRTTTKKIDSAQPMVITQYDPEWCSSNYGAEGQMGPAGCGVLCVVNAVYALSGQYMDVMELANYSVEKGHRVIDHGTADTLFKDAAYKLGPKYGFTWAGSSDKISTLVKRLKEGQTAVSHISGHYECISDISGDGKYVLVMDSGPIPARETSAFGDWVPIEKLEEGPLKSVGYFFFKQASEDPKDDLPKEKPKKKDKKDAKDTKDAEETKDEANTADNGNAGNTEEPGNTENAGNTENTEE